MSCVVLSAQVLVRQALGPQTQDARITTFGKTRTMTTERRRRSTAPSPPPSPSKEDRILDPDPVLTPPPAQSHCNDPLGDENRLNTFKNANHSPTTFAPSPTTGDHDSELSELESEGESHTMSGYIARVRYENPLPPPEFAPKLLEIPGTGLSSSQYLMPGYSTRMWREQALNIEADAELGMPLDLVGMPGIFDGDESSIQAPDHPPAPHPRDKAILRKPTQLGKPTSAASGVSFLRRTEYISAEASRPRFDATGGSRQGRSTSAGKKRRQSEVSQDDPINILKTIVKGFDIAYPSEAYTGPDTASNIQGHKPTAAEIEAWNNPQHPTKKNLKVLDSYPILPDLDAFPDSGGYMVMKFATNPLAAGDQYDTRLDVGLLRPLELRPEVQASHDASKAAHQADPTKPPPGPPPFDYEFSIPPDQSTVKNIKKAFDVDDPDRDNPDLYDAINKETGDRSFRYSRVRAYETAITSGSFGQKYDEVALALHDPEDEVGLSVQGKKQKAAYYYPILQKSQIRPRRSMAQQLSMLGGRQAEETDENRVDYLDITIRDADEAEAARRAEHRRVHDTLVAEGEEEEGVEEEDEGHKIEQPDEMEPVEKVEADV
ncbi:MAG: hypothetical protein M1837_005693 [Sclerophora amabilis]|nr:MAG: hypothetical protein M1837_005693 [Sclerophora amabilis]